MKFAAAASTLLLVGSAVAAPGTAMRAERHQKRVASGRKGNPLNRVEAPADSHKSNVEYSSNWAGAILIGTGYTSVTGTFTAPTPSTAGSGSAWVGIDGDTCTTAILQTGIDWTLSGTCFISTLREITNSKPQVPLLLMMLGMSGTPTTPTISLASTSHPVTPSP